jgi:peptidoglycan/LPS O-acetylase OafA/YrhL
LIGLTFLVAALSHEFIEKPFLRLKGKVQPMKTASPLSTTAIRFPHDRPVRRKIDRMGAAQRLPPFISTECDRP